MPRLPSPRCPVCLLLLPCRRYYDSNEALIPFYPTDTDILVATVST